MCLEVGCGRLFHFVHGVMLVFLGCGCGCMLGVFWVSLVGIFCFLVRMVWDCWFWVVVFIVLFCGCFWFVWLCFLILVGSIVSNSYF